LTAGREDKDYISSSKHEEDVDGYRVPVKRAIICPECKSWIDNAARICPICGLRVKQRTPLAKGGRCRIVAALLALFLGVAGAHKFYLGSIKMGILYVLISLTAIGFAITLALSIYDSFVLFTMSDEEFAKKYD